MLWLQITACISVINVVVFSQVVWDIDKQNQYIRIIDYCPYFPGCKIGYHVQCIRNPNMRSANEYDPACGKLENGYYQEMTPPIADRLLAAFNAIRSKVALGKESGLDNDNKTVLFPRGYGMYRLQWDPELATHAQAWTRQCKINRERLNATAMCFASKKFPDPGIIWDFAEITDFPDPKSLYEQHTTLRARIIASLFSMVKKWYLNKNLIKENIKRMPLIFDPRTIENWPEVTRYYNIILGRATHVGCGFSVHRELPQILLTDSLRHVYIVELACNFSERVGGTIRSNLFLPKIPTGPGFSKNCGCPLNSIEGPDCLCSLPNSNVCLEGTCKNHMVLLPIITVEDVVYDPKLNEAKRRSNLNPKSDQQMQSLVDLTPEEGPSNFNRIRNNNLGKRRQMKFKDSAYWTPIRRQGFNNRHFRDQSSSQFGDDDPTKQNNVQKSIRPVKKIETAQQPVAVIQQSVIPIQQSVVPKQQSVASEQQSITNVLQKVVPKQQLVASEQQSVASAQQSVTSMQQSVANVQQSVASVQQSVEPEQQSSSYLPQSVAPVQQSVATVQQPVANVQQSVTSVQQSVEPEQQPISYLPQSVAPVQQSVTIVQQPVATLQEPVATAQKSSVLVQITKRELDSSKTTKNTEMISTHSPGEIKSYNMTPPCSKEHVDKDQLTVHYEALLRLLQEKLSKHTLVSLNKSPDIDRRANTTDVTIKSNKNNIITISSPKMSIVTTSFYKPNNMTSEANLKNDKEQNKIQSNSDVEIEFSYLLEALSKNDTHEDNNHSENALLQKIRPLILSPYKHSYEDSKEEVNTKFHNSEQSTKGSRKINEAINKLLDFRYEFLNQRTTSDDTTLTSFTYSTEKSVLSVALRDNIPLNKDNLVNRFLPVKNKYNRRPEMKTLSEEEFLSQQRRYLENLHRLKNRNFNMRDHRKTPNLRKTLFGMHSVDTDPRILQQLKPVHRKLREKFKDPIFMRDSSMFLPLN